MIAEGFYFVCKFNYSYNLPFLLWYLWIGKPEDRFADMHDENTPIASTIQSNLAVSRYFKHLIVHL